jgi:hypothetical protein
LARAQAACRREATRRTPDWDRLFELHHAFHELLRARLAGPRLRLLLDGLRPHLDRYEYFYGRLHGTGFEATFAEHDAIVAAVAAGRADGAERAVRANWFHGAERLAAAVQRAGEAGVLRAPAADAAHGRGPGAAPAARAPRTPAGAISAAPRPRERDRVTLRQSGRDGSARSGGVHQVPSSR